MIRLKPVLVALADGHQVPVTECQVEAFISETFHPLAGPVSDVKVGNHNADIWFKEFLRWLSTNSR